MLSIWIIGCTTETQTDTKPEEQPTQIANPASVHCIEQGGTLRIETEAAGQYGICTLPDGTECEEWAYFRGECPEKEVAEKEDVIEETQTEATDATTAATEYIDPSLIVHLKFDDNAEDSANNYDGTIKGGAAFIEGKDGKALSFDGFDDYVDLPQGAVSKVGDLAQGTIAFWFKFQSILDKQTVMPIFYIGGKEKDSDNIFIIEIGHFDEQSFDAVPVPDPSNKKLYVTWIKNNRDTFLCYDSNVNLEENKWHHFAVVVGDGGNTGYLDGVELTNRNYNFGNSKNPSFLDDITDNKKLMLGYGRSSYMLSPDFIYYKGALDDLRIYNKPLSQSEIKELII